MQLLSRWDSSGSKAKTSAPSILGCQPLLNGENSRITGQNDQLRTLDCAFYGQLTGSPLYVTPAQCRLQRTTRKLRAHPADAGVLLCAFMPDQAVTKLGVGMEWNRSRLGVAGPPLVEGSACCHPA